MNRRLALCLLLIISIAVLGTLYSSARTLVPDNPAPSKPAIPILQSQCKSGARIPLTGKTCGKVQDLQLSCNLPADIVPTPSPPAPPNYNVMQRSADIFSWQEFIALNWPALAGQRGVPDPDRPIGFPGPRVWETWKEEYEVYRPDGKPPVAWNVPEQLPAACSTGGATKVFFRTQKIDDIVDSTLQAAAATASPLPTLTDQKRNLVRYEIRLNKVMFDYIVQQQLYDAHVQTVARSVSFPDGGMLLKAAWREVSPAEEPLFHTVTACVCDKQKDGTLANCRTKRMGLVGFHITQKTPSSPQWIWSTFEQVNNVPEPSGQAPYSFNNPNCTTCPPNKQTPRGTPTQIKRDIPIPSSEPDCLRIQDAVDNVRILNQDVQRVLKDSGSVFSRYQLINTQFPLPPTGLKPSTAFSVLPAVLGNTTMESFVQPTSTCMGCHATARSVNQNRFVSSDFSFTLNNAQPLLPGCKVIPPPAKPVTTFDRLNWTAIKRGYELVTNTYELLPKFVPKAKLHCSSCHLNAGGNSDAAWWVDLKTEYPTKPDLQARINHCFTNSLNGYELCTPAGKGSKGNCDGNTDMNAITTYMQWLDEQAAIIPLCNTVAHGYPPISNGTGNVTNGQKTFVQKCAVCHGQDGQGRYENNTYYRPALWGPHSFNQAAGMFSDPAMLAAFARWNMPLMAGGLLTDQEAWDVEAFIHSQSRPVSPPSPSPTP
ncbi:MAG: Cytochrome c family protein [Acidobacteria bacterium]|nr:Cytochrome c family protein [Acidobacteriota bacterium]